jgi:hypothetical protein
VDSPSLFRKSVAASSQLAGMSKNATHRHVGNVPPQGLEQGLPCIPSRTSG